MTEWDPQRSAEPVIQEIDDRSVPESVDALQAHFAKLYGRRNNIWLPSRRQRIRILGFAIREVDDFIKKDASLEQQEVMFARIPSRIFCIAHGMNNVSVARAMSERFPLTKCAYCHQMPCQCQERRPDSELQPANPQQLAWRLRKWQFHLHQLYGKRNAEKGIDYVMLRLSKERTELDYAEGEADKEIKSADEIEHDYALELADCMAWTIAAANLQEIDLEAATLKRFFPKCWSCKQEVCVCIGFNQRQVRVNDEPRQNRKPWD